MDNVVELTVMTSMVGNKELKPDADGYYLVTLGAFNVRNSAGEVYLFNGVKEILADTNNTFNKRLSGGRLRAEAEHPKRPPGMTDEGFILRNLEISTKEACGHIKEVRIKETRVTEGIPGIGNVVLTTGLIKPSGTYGKGLKDSLDNPEEDTCFSIRCFTRDTPTSVGITKQVLQIVNWDWINDPGIRYASKLGAPTTESACLGKFSLDELNSAKEISGLTGQATESRDSVEIISEILDTCERKDIIDSW